MCRSSSDMTATTPSWKFSRPWPYRKKVFKNLASRSKTGALDHPWLTQGLDKRLAVTHKTRLDHPHRVPLAANFYLGTFVGSRRHTGQGNGFTQSRREAAAGNLTFAHPFNPHHLMRTQHAALFQHQAHQLGGNAFGLLLLQRGTANKATAGRLPGDGPGHVGGQWCHTFVHILAVKVHPGFQAQGIARAKTDRGNTSTDQLIKEIGRASCRER